MWFYFSNFAANNGISKFIQLLEYFSGCMLLVRRFKFKTD